jgi:gluconolactonase
MDDQGRLWAAAHDGLHCFTPDGRLIGKLLLPEVVSNLTFGGPKRNVLYITATHALFSIMVNFTGVSHPAALRNAPTPVPGTPSPSA